MPRRWILAVCSLSWCLLASAIPRARADVVPPGFQACVGKTAGTRCASGVCRATTCSKLDYASWDRDAEPVPPTAHYACVLCVPDDGSAADSAPEDSGCAAGGSAASGGGAALGFALVMGLWLGGRLRRKAR